MAEGDPNPFEQLAPVFERDMEAVGAAMVETVKSRLSVLCSVYHASVARHDHRHSLPGEHPRYETGRLLESIAHAVYGDDPQRIVLLVDTDAPYAAQLEIGMNRPIFRSADSSVDVLTEFEPVALEALAASIANH